MDFGFSEVQEDLRGLARTILGDEVTPERLKELEAGSERMDRRTWEALAAANLLGVCLPEAVGGSGYGMMELAVVLAEVGRRVAPVPLLETVGLVAMPIARFGTDEQQQRWLPSVVAGRTVLTAALEEPAAHDPADIRTTARPDGSGWILEGEKVAVPWGPLAERILVTAAIEGAVPGLFLVDPTSPGASLAPAESTHRQPQAGLVLDGVHVDGGDVIADPDAVPWLIRHAVAGMCATATGVLDEAVRITAAYLSEREQFGRPLATFQGAALRAADAYIDTRAVEVATWSAIWRLADGADGARADDADDAGGALADDADAARADDADDALAVAKFWVADGGQRVVAACQHLHGGIGVDVDYVIHRYFLWAKALELAAGGATTWLLRLGASMAA